jgi:threonine/homoserine/homoserine lactone efflux protein
MMGIGFIISQSIVLFNLIKLAGAAYLIFLGINMIRTKPQIKTGESDIANEAVSLTDGKAFRIGFLTNTLNPKTTLFVVSLFSQVIDPSTSFFIQLSYGFFMSFAHLVWFWLVACLFSSRHARSLVQNARHWIERSIGSVLVILGVALAATSLRDR